MSNGHETCVQCGFDGADFDDRALLEALRDLGRRWRALVASGAGLIRERPSPEVWSALEYAAHSRDITLLHIAGVELALTGDEPDLGRLDGDAAIEAAAKSYPALDPDVVVGELASAADRLASAATVDTTTWHRGITVDGHRQDVRGLLEHALHDSHHHLDDVQRGFAVLAAER